MISEKKKILIVEDEFITQKDLKEMLLNMDYNPVDCAINAEDAILLTEKHHPDLILMDIMLKSSMTGIEAAKIIKQDHDIPIIYLTAYSDKDTFSKAKETQPSSYIIKPVTNEDDLRTTIELTLHNHQKKIEEKAKFQQKITETEEKLEKSEKKFDQIKKLLQIESNFEIGSESITPQQEEQISLDYNLLFSDPDIDQWFSALGNVDRIEICKLIQKEPKKINDFENALKKARTTVKHHLATLEKLDIIIGKISGKYIYFSLTQDLPFLDSFDSETLANCCDALSNVDRLRIIESLIKSPTTIPEIENLIEKSQASVSHHLRILETCGLIMIQKKGRSNFYSLDKNHLNQMLSFYSKWKSRHTN